MSDEGFHEIQLNGKQLVFLFMAATVVSVVQGTPRDDTPQRYHDRLGTYGPALLLMTAVLVLGLWVPAPMEDAVRDAALFVEAVP